MPSRSGWPDGRFLALGDELVGDLLELEAVHLAAGQKVGIARVHDGHLAQHLARDDLDVLVVDVHALGYVHALDLTHDVAQRRVRVGEAQQVVRVHRALGELLADLDLAAVAHARQQLGTGAHHVLAVVALLVVDRDGLGLLVARDLHGARDLGEHRLALGLAGLEQLLDARETVGDVLARNTAGVERAHGQLRARLADGLGGNDAHRRADVDRTRRGQVPAVALLAHAVVGMAGHDRADDHLGDARVLERLHLGHGRDVLAAGHHHGTVGCHGVFQQAAADQVLVEVALLVVDGVRHAVVGAAVDLADDDVLGHVHQTTGQVPRVGGTQRRVGQALAGAMRGNEVFQDRQAFAEVRLDGPVDDLALRVGHEAAHTSQLADLLDIASGARERHHVDGVELVEVLGHGLADLFVRLVPDVHDLLVALFLAHEAHLVVLVDGGHLRVGLRQDLALVRRHGGVVHRHGDAGARGVVEARVLQAVQDGRHVGAARSGCTRPPRDG